MGCNSEASVTWESVDRASISKEVASHLKIVRKGVANWNEWRARNPGIVPKLIAVSLVGENLAGVNFSSMFLAHADLRGADLRGADLRNSNASFADFYRANLTNAKLDSANFESAKLVGVDARGTSFQSARLEHVDLNNSNLEGALFTECRMGGVNLQFARLQHASLCEAVLECASLEYATLEDADLKRADLQHCDFHGSALDRCDISEAVMGFTRVISVDLSNVIGLERTLHKFPSSVGADTLAQTAASLSPDDHRLARVEDFYRKAGLLECLIDSVRPGTRAPYKSCFISYSHADKRFALELYDRLQYLGVRCWLDGRSLKPGERILDALANAIDSQDKVLLCCSRASLESWWVKDEIRKAQEKERRESSTIIVPVMLDSYLLEGWSDGLAADLRSRLAVDFTAWEEDGSGFEERLEQLLDSLRN